MSALRPVPAVLAALVLAAHFFRWGSLVATAICLAMPIAFFLRGRSALVLSRVFLILGAGVWVLNATRFARERMAEGRPYLRMVAILAAVAALTLGAAWLLPDRRDRASS